MPTTTPQPTVDITYEFRAAPLRFTVDPATRTLSVAPHLDDLSNSSNCVSVVMPENTQTEDGLDLLAVESWITAQMPRLRTRFTRPIYFRRYEHPLVARHSAVVTLPDGCVIRPIVRRDWHQGIDTYLFSLFTGRDADHLAQTHVYERPMARTGIQLLAGFEEAAEHVPPLIVRPDMNMDYPETMPEGLPRGTRVIPAHELAAGARIVAIYRYSDRELKRIKPHLTVTGSYTASPSSADQDRGPHQKLTVTCANPQCEIGHHHLKVPHRCAVGVLD